MKVFSKHKDRFLILLREGLVPSRGGYRMKQAAKGQGMQAMCVPRSCDNLKAMQGESSVEKRSHGAQCRWFDHST